MNHRASTTRKKNNWAFHTSLLTGLRSLTKHKRRILASEYNSCRFCHEDENSIHIWCECEALYHKTHSIGLANTSPNGNPWESSKRHSLYIIVSCDTSRSRSIKTNSVSYLSIYIFFRSFKRVIVFFKINGSRWRMI